MNTLIILFLILGFLVAAYIIYGRTMERLWRIDPSRPTPAHRCYDGVDYVPCRQWPVLFGHHFASIAGAGPIVGPAIAVCLWGWGPALLWIVLGSVFIGGIHDFGALMVSVREEGRSIGDVAALSLSQKAKWVLSVFTLAALILVIAVFAHLAAKTFVNQPDIVGPSLGLIPIAMGFGWMVSARQMNMPTATITALALLALLIWSAQTPLVQQWHWDSLMGWQIVLLVYCLIASVLPVQWLLQPRDYLSSYLLVAGIGLSIAGLFVAHPAVQTPMWITDVSHQGFQGWVWPMMFITIACGANSGFHSLIASGTTSKQLATEAHAKRIGYGAMLLEGLLAVLVVLMIAGAYSPSEFTAMVQSKIDPMSVYAEAFGRLTRTLTAGRGQLLALLVLNAFILTTLDSATRISRYILEEITGLRQRWLSTGLVVAAAAVLTMGKGSGSQPLWAMLWPVFGASNQLVAALALLVISAWLLRHHRRAVMTLIPAAFMLTTSLAALILQMVNHWTEHRWLLIAITALLIATALILLNEVRRTFLLRKVDN